MELPVVFRGLFDDCGQEVLEQVGMGNVAFGIEGHTIDTVITDELDELFEIFEASVGILLHKDVDRCLGNGVVATPGVEEDDTATVGHTVLVTDVAVCTYGTDPRLRPSALAVEIRPHGEVVAIHHIAREGLPIGIGDAHRRAETELALVVALVIGNHLGITVYEAVLNLDAGNKEILVGRKLVTGLPGREILIERLVVIDVRHIFRM